MAKVRVNCGPTSDECPVKLYEVWNTANNRLYVLARDAKRAMSIAYTANHVYDPTPTMAETYSRLVEEVKSPRSDVFSAHWASIESAIAQRIEGTVQFAEGQIFVGVEPFATHL